MGAAHLGDDGDGRLLARAETGTDTYGVEVIGVDGFREGRLLAVELDDGFRDAHLHDHVVSFRCMGSHLADSNPQTGFRGQYGSTSHAIAARYDQGVAHLALMGKGVALDETRTDITLLQQRVVGVDLLDAFLAETDVEHLHLSEELLILREQERQFLLL